MATDGTASAASTICSSAASSERGCVASTSGGPAGHTSAMQAWRLVTGARHVFRIAAAVLVDALRRQLQHPIGQRGKEMAIMRDEQHGAFVVRQRRDEH